MARPSLDRNVKFKRLVRRLGIPRPYVRGLLETIWDVCNESGEPLLGAPEDVEAAAEWPGEPGELFDALAAGRWIEETPDGWRVHDFFHHCPRYVAQRRKREIDRQRQGQRLQNGDAKLRHDPERAAYLEELDALIEAGADVSTRAFVSLYELLDSKAPLERIDAAFHAMLDQEEAHG